MKVQFKGLDEMQRQLTELSKSSMSRAARETLDTLAFAGRRIWQDEMAESSTLRNQYTTRRVLVERAFGGSFRGGTIQAVLGHPEDYVRQLEEGEPTRASGSAVPVPTDLARGGNKKNLVRRPNKLAAIGKLKKSGAPTRKARNSDLIRRAAKSGKKFALLDMGKSKGVFKISGGKRKLRVRRVWDLARRVTPRPERPTLQRTLDQVVSKLGPATAEKAMTKQLRKLGML